MGFLFRARFWEKPVSTFFGIRLFHLRSKGDTVFNGSLHVTESKDLGTSAKPSKLSSAFALKRTNGGRQQRSMLSLPGSRASAMSHRSVHCHYAEQNGSLARPLQPPHIRSFAHKIFRESAASGRWWIWGSSPSSKKLTVPKPTPLAACRSQASKVSYAIPRSVKGIGLSHKAAMGSPVTAAAPKLSASCTPA